MKVLKRIVFSLIVASFLGLIVVYHITSKPIATTIRKQAVDFISKVVGPKNYSIIAASVPNFLNETIYIDKDGKPLTTDRAWGYIYNLPMTVEAWKRFGYGVIVIITIDYKNTAEPAMRLLRYVVRILEQKGAFIVYFDVPSHMMVRLSQNLRLVAGEFDFLQDDDRIMTSDSDLWPLNPERYIVPHEKEICITFANCCGKFRYDGSFITQYPLSTIAMKKKTWRKIFSSNIVGEHARYTYTYDNIKPFVKRLKMFTKTLLNSTDLFEQGRNSKMWAVDQLYASVMITNYIEDAEHYKAFAPINGFKCLRISTSTWHKRLALKGQCYSDAHVFKNSPWWYWKDLKLLMDLIYDKETVKYYERYKITFQNIYDGLVD